MTIHCEQTTHVRMLGTFEKISSNNEIESMSTDSLFCVIIFHTHKLEYDASYNGRASDFNAFLCRIVEQIFVVRKSPMPTLLSLSISVFF